MRSSKLIIAVLLSSVLGASASWAGPDYRMFGKNARMRDVAGEVITADTNWWGARYIVVKDRGTGLRVYVQSNAAACIAGRSFKGKGHLTRADEKDYDATFHLHLTDAGTVCG